MARRPRKMVTEYAEKFLSTDYRTDIGVMGKCYSVVLPDCKVFMKCADRTVVPEIEMIKFPSFFLIRNPDIWNNLSSGCFPFPDLNKYLQTQHCIQKSKQFDCDEKSALIQLGNDRLFLFCVPIASRSFSVERLRLDDLLAEKGRPLVVAIKNENIINLKEVRENYFSTTIFRYKHLLLTPTVEEDVPSLSNFFTKNELNLMDKPLEIPGSFVHERSHFELFSHIPTKEFEQWKTLSNKRQTLINRLKEHRVPMHLKYNVSDLKWNPGCQSISDGVNLYIKGPWEIRDWGKRDPDFTNALTEKWHVVYSIS